MCGNTHNYFFFILPFHKRLTIRNLTGCSFWNLPKRRHPIQPPCIGLSLNQETWKHKHTLPFFHLYLFYCFISQCHKHPTSWHSAGLPMLPTVHHTRFPPILPPPYSPIRLHPPRPIPHILVLVPTEAHKLKIRSARHQSLPETTVNNSFSRSFF